MNNNSTLSIFFYLIILLFLFACTPESVTTDPTTIASTNQIITVQTADTSIPNNEDVELSAEKQFLDEETLSQDYGLTINEDYSGDWDGEEQSVPIVFIEKGGETSDPNHNEFIVVIDDHAYSLSQTKQFEYRFEDGKSTIKSLWTQLLNDDGEIIGEFVFRYNSRGRIVPEETLYAEVPDDKKEGVQIDTKKFEELKISQDKVQEKDEELLRPQATQSPAIRADVCFNTGADNFIQTEECTYYRLTHKDSPLLVPRAALSLIAKREERKKETVNEIVLYDDESISHQTVTYVEPADVNDLQ